MKYTNVLSLKYRPQRFSDVIGQKVACRILSKASSMNTVAPAYILSGTRGVGKTTLARIFAKALLCEQAPTDEPCNNCSHCIRISKGHFVDVIELDAASHRSIDDIRDLRENVGFSPMEGRYKIFILDEAHMLTKEAYNALLKTLEEPPPFVVFIFASTDIQKFPATIISRCQHIALKSVPTNMLIEHLSQVLDKEGIQYTKDAIELIARRGFGSVRDSLSLLGQVLIGVNGKITKESVEEMLGLATQDVYISVVEAIISGNTLDIINITHSLLEKGIDIKYFLQELTALCRTLYLVKQYQQKALRMLEIPDEYHNTLLQCTEVLSLQHIHICWQMVLYGQQQVLESIEPSIALELLLLNVVSIRNMVPTDNYVEHISSKETKREHPLIDIKKQGGNKHSGHFADIEGQQAEEKETYKQRTRQHTEKREEKYQEYRIHKKDEYDGVESKGQKATLGISSPQVSIRDKMAHAIRNHSFDIEGNPVEYEIVDMSEVPLDTYKDEIIVEEEKDTTDRESMIEEYTNKNQYPILDIIEEEFNTTYKYIRKDREE